jgi:pyridoxamine 5'-phosphate oxidase family protein
VQDSEEHLVTVFTPNELAYLRGQRVGRLATADAAGRPHVVPIGFSVDGATGVVEIGGHAQSGGGRQRLYLANIAVNAHAAFEVDDLLSVDPWTPRGITLRGVARIRSEGGERLGPGFGTSWVEIVPERVVSWGIDTGSFDPPHARWVG